VATLVSIIPNYGAVSRLQQPNSTFVSSWRVTFVETHFSSVGYGYYRCVKLFTPHAIAWSVRKGFNPGLACWPSWGQISKIWSQITLAGPKIFVWPFSRLDWPLARIRSCYPGTCLRSHIFSLFWLIDCRFSPNSCILKVFTYKILLRYLDFLS